MRSKNGQPQHISIAKRLLVAGLALLFMFVFFSPRTYAQQHSQLSGGPSILSVQAGFNGTYRAGSWIPIQIKVGNNGNPFDGIMSVSLSTVYTGKSTSSTSISVYQTVISLPAISQKRFDLYVPIEETNNGQGARNSLTIHLRDNNNHEVATKSVPINNVGSNELYIGLISDQTLDTRQLTEALGEQNAYPRVEPLSPSMLPTAVEAFNNFDLLILDDAITSTLSNDQRTALQGWVGQGGTLIEVGGPEWHSTLGSLPPSLLPVAITGTDTVAAGQRILPQDGKNQGEGGQAQGDVPVSVGTPRAGSLVLVDSSNVPLIVQASVGQGLVYYLAYDPFLAPLVSWTNTSNLWADLLLRTLGDQILIISNSNTSPLVSKYNLYQYVNSFLESLIPNAFPSIWLILILLISYVLILGPLRFLLIRWSKKKAWSWRIVVVTIVVFSLLSYGLALQVKGTSVVSSTISVLQLSEPDGSGSQAHVTDYVGVYVPGRGDFQVHMPGTRLVEATDQSSFYGSYRVQSLPSGQSSLEKTAITTQRNSTDVDLQGVDTWTLRALATKYETHIRGGIVSNLSFTKNTITGTVTNTSPYILNDAYLLIGTNFIPVGNLASGQTKSVQAELVSMPRVSNGVPITLADQIASNKGMSVNPYSDPFSFSASRSTDENYRHVAMLETLSGGNCNGGSCINGYNGSIGRGLALQPHVLDGPVRNYSRDPLLLAGAPATIIGWINNSVGKGANSFQTNITLNNGTVPSTQESLLQAPLNLHFTGTVDVPSALSTEQIVDVQPGPNSNDWPEAVASDTYSLTTGSMTFEIQLPVTGNLQNEGTGLTLTFNDTPVALKYPSIYLGLGPTNDANTMSIGLYNWQTNTWDSETFNANTFKVDNAQRYVGPSGRVLIQFANGQNSQTAAVFTMPDVELNATIAG